MFALNELPEWQLWVLLSGVQVTVPFNHHITHKAKLTLITVLPFPSSLAVTDVVISQVCAFPCIHTWVRCTLINVYQQQKYKDKDSVCFFALSEDDKLPSHCFYANANKLRTEN